MTRQSLKNEDLCFLNCIFDFLCFIFEFVQDLTWGLRGLFRVKRGISFLAMTEKEVANGCTQLKEMMIVSIIFMFMVSVAQWLRRQVVALEIVGSNPTVHPS